MAAETAAAAAVGGETETGPRSADRATRIAFGVVAVILVLFAWKAPIWQAKLSAPQYPGGLRLTAYGSGVVGDLREINELNHYVGMEAFSDANAPEMKLWGPVLLLAVIGVGVGTFLPRKNWLGKFARVGLWSVPIGALIDVQFRLYQYGHGVKPDAAIRLDPFMPLVVGPTHVLNFTTWAYPGNALVALFLAAFMVMFGPGLLHRIQRRMHREDSGQTSASEVAEAS